MMSIEQHAYPNRREKDATERRLFWRNAKNAVVCRTLFWKPYVVC